MRSVKYGPTAHKDESGNWIFTKEILAAYKNNLIGQVWPDEDIEPGVEFQFTNGPYGGGMKLVVVVVGEFEIDGIMTEAVIAREK